MVAKILVFGAAKDIMGGTMMELELDEDMTTGALRNMLEERYPRLKRLSTFMIAINNDYATGHEVISELDEIAIIPPVSGG